MSDQQSGLAAPMDTGALVAEAADAIRTDNLLRAVEIARRGLDAGVIHPLLLHLRGHWLADQDRIGEALQDLGRAKELAPNEPRIPNEIGECLLKDDRFADAVTAFEQALALWPEFPLAHYNRGFALEALGELREAEESYRRAARLDPNYADPPARIGGLAAVRGDWSLARSFADHALVLEKDNVTAILTKARADIAEGATDRAGLSLQSVIADDRKHPLERANALSLLGDVRNAEGRTAEAFSCYETANARFREAYAPRLSARGVEPTRALISRIATYVDSQDENPLHARARPPLPGANGIAFVVGFPRSGTTLLGQILASHPDTVTLEEKFPIVEADRNFLRTADGLELLAQASERELQRYRDSYWQFIRRFGLHVRDKLVVDKLPTHAMRLPVIARLFPQAKIVLAIRDPRDVVLSAFRRLFLVHAFTLELLDLKSTAQLYADMMNLTELCRARLGLKWMDVRNEDVATYFDEQTQALCTFLGLPWRESMRNFGAHARRSVIATPSSAQVIRGLTTDSVGQWRRYREQLAPVLPILQPWIERYGYPAE